MSSALSKKQQKAQAFRSKQKAKKGGKEDIVPEDVPEQDLVEDEDVKGEEDQPVIAEASKKRKREDEAVLDKKKADVKGKGKAKTAWDEEEGGDAKGKKGKKEIKQRFILFVGNLGYKTTREEVQAHFTEAAGNKPAVRLLTTKPAPKSNEPPKSRGIAFLELPSSEAMQACLKLHHTSIGGRRINVELTAGGGGKSDVRSEKIKARNERVGGQRERRAEKEKEAAGETGEAVQTETGNDEARAKRRRTGRSDKPTEEKPVEVVREDGQTVNADGQAVKIRGGRRTKVKAKTDDAPRRFQQSGGYGGNDRYDRRRGDNQGGGRGGYQGGGGGRGGARQGGQGFRPKWEPTGANAVTVG